MHQQIWFLADVPPGARCDFDTPLSSSSTATAAVIGGESGCKNWQIFTMSGATSNRGASEPRYLHHIVEAADAKRRRPASPSAASSSLYRHFAPPPIRTFHGARRNVGGYLLFSTHIEATRSGSSGGVGGGGALKTGAQTSMSGGADVLYTFAASPTFPPTSSTTDEFGSPNYRTCQVSDRKNIFRFMPHSLGSFFLLLDRLANISTFARKRQRFCASRGWSRTIGDDCGLHKRTMAAGFVEAAIALGDK